tara:strand:- start:977 stop:1447 length:471 start_codon:yes stop_codon:yes gene_type:complete
MNIFNPDVCFVDELKASWAANIATEGSPNKIPVVSRGTNFFLNLSQETGSPWAAAVIPMSKNWDSVDISQFVDLNFNFYSPRAYSLKVSLVDAHEVESHVISINEMGFPSEDYNSVVIPVTKFTKGHDSFEPEECRLLKFIITEDSSVMLSRIILD